MLRLVAPRVVASMAALAMLVAGVLPSPHVHQQENDAVIHRHLIDHDSAHHDEDAHHETSLDHDSHVTARVLPLTYDTGAPFSLRCSPALTILAADEPAPAIARAANRATILATHDPPLRFVCSPAPPASA